ncbi:centrosome-associated protein 350 isoform X2 [Mastacembelus armatus]|uniref:centrosome-associated protein 350 isoform X2 n=1 Tax=Mastacembelus armatus TaxID=205130 RepID=UPI000E4620A2|nr:centrosome-associated protein 350 isoform X2 [Mastacembelus armatus]
MRSTRRTEVSLKNPAQQLTDHNIGTELTAAWKSLAQSKAALRHIENRLEAAPGTGVLLESVMDPPKKKSSRMVCCKDGQQADNSGGSSKRRGRSQQSPEKSSSRSPLRNTTQDSNVRRNNSVDFREPLVSYREATPPSSQLEAYSLHSAPGSLYPSSPPPSDPLLSRLVYQRDTRDKQTDRDLDSTHSSALESTEVRYLNDQPVLDTLRTFGNHSHLTGVREPAREGAGEDSSPKAQFVMDSQETSPCLASASASATMCRGESTPSTSPGSASQRLENLRRHQPDDKLEKLKERIRRQRQHLEEAAEREKLLGNLEQPVMTAVGSSYTGTSNMPTAKIRKVAAAPPAPIYKGFNSTETKIRTPDGKVWKEEEFHNLSREIYRDLTRQFAESTRHQQQREQRADRSKERRPPKPVRKVHRAAPASDLNAKPVISPASWREGQKLVKMVLGPIPKLHGEEDQPHSADRQSKTASCGRSSSHPHPESNRQSHLNGTEQPRGGFQSKSHSRNTSTPSSGAQDKGPVGISTGLLSADIQGILDDLQLECKASEEEEERARQRSRGGSSGRRGRGGSGSRTRTPVSSWATTVATGRSSRGCRSASPTTRRPETADIADARHKKRHYDADTVRQYIARQQEERKRRQAEEKRALREEVERRNQRLQELYKRQREVAKTVTLPSEVPVAPVQKRLQETYTKLLLEEAQLGDKAPQTQPAPPSSQMRPIYQPSGESDKENKRLEAAQSPSSSDRSLNDHLPPPLRRGDLDIGVASLLQPDHLSPAARPAAGPSSSGLAPFGEHFLSQLFKLDTAVPTDDIKHTHRPATAPSNRSHSKMSRIEALKATAASLSNRIESEARKLVGEGVNYGTATSMDIDTVLAPGPSHTYLDGCWAEAAATQNNDMDLRLQRVLTSTGQSSYNGAALSGAGSPHTLRGQKEKKAVDINVTNAQTTSYLTGPIFNSDTQARRKLVNGLEEVEGMDNMAARSGYDKEDNQADLHDSSAGSISEGPILSEGSLSEDEASPPHPFMNHAPRAADRLGAVEYCAGQRTDYLRLSEFQREAEKCSTLKSPFVQQDNSKAAWDELNRGSPLSVINIFTKNLQGHVKVSERNSPSAHSVHSGNGPGEAAIYEDDFVSSNSSRMSGQLRKSSNSPSVNSHFEELMRRSPYEKNTGGISSHHSSFHSSVQSSHPSSGSTSGSSPLSKHSSRKRGTASDQSDATLVEEQRSSCSPPSEALSSDSRKRGSDKSSAHSQDKSVHSSDTLGETSGHSPQSLGLDDKKSRAVRPKWASPCGSPDPGFTPRAESPSGSLGANIMNTGTTARSARSDTRTTGELQYSPAVLQQRMAAELQYLESIEESVRQLDNMEKLMGLSMAQQESASLAQMLKAKQQQHERDLYELKIKAEREALETKLQLEENRQRVARAHIELQGNLVASQKEALDGVQEATTKMMSQQAEAAQYTADAARHIKEMTELARTQIAGALVIPPVATKSSVLEQPEEKNSFYMKKRQEETESDSFHSEVSSRRNKPDEPLSSLNSLSHSDSLSFRRPNISGADSSSCHSSSRVSSHQRDQTKKEEDEGRRGKRGPEGRLDREAGSSSIEEEVPTAANDSLCSDSIPSVVEEKGDSTSVATEYSLKFDESMTEDEIEERSFRSLLPSEAHRRGTMEKKPRTHEESEDDGANHNTRLVSGAHNILKDVSMAFSSGQDSFSQFTMDMVRQYMKDEEVRLQHQSALLRLRQKALKEKTRTELAWLEHQKKRLRDKGEDDKMPPIRKKQRGLLMKLQQEQAEIKRLQEANKAAMKERQLLLKQQEEIERMRNSTLRLKERLKSAGGEAPPETPVSETPVSEPAFPSMTHANDNRSPSPSLSVSGSETSSIMQKLKKMHSHMDEKFLTKREQQLMQRRRHAEELLQWKQRLDQEEAEVRRMEKEALAVWDRETPGNKEFNVPESQEKECSDMSSSPRHHQSSEPRTDSEKEYVSEGSCTSATPESSIHTEALGSQQPGSPSSVQPESAPETPLASVQSSPANYTQDFTSAPQSPSRHASLCKGSHSPAGSPSDGSSKTKMQLHSSARTSNQAHSQQTDSPMASQTEPISDQSDIESRIKALKEELRKRKFMAYQLKKEQKKRHKERLKAQEASLLKQLETYNNIIEKTKAELNKEPDSAPDNKSTSAAEDSTIKSAVHRSENSKLSERTCTDASLHHYASPQLDHSASTSVPEELSDEDPPTVTPSLVHGSPDYPLSGLQSLQSAEALLRPSSHEAEAQIIESGAEILIPDKRADIQEELEVEASSGLDHRHSEHVFKLEDRLDSQEKLSTSKHASSSMSEEHGYSRSEAEDVVKPTTKSHSAEIDFKTSAHPSRSTDPSCSPHSGAFSSQKEPPIKDAEASSLLADGYHDDFESSVDLSPREEHHSSKAESQISVSTTEIRGLIKDSPVRNLPYDSQEGKVEEEIAEELSDHSEASEPSQRSFRLLDLHKQTEDSKHDHQSINSSLSPPISPLQTALTAVTDVMPDFNIGDRVLVGGVQPGTLRFKGPTSFANGFWAGVELDKSEGSNNGTYDGVVYFECNESHGIFAPPEKITHLPDKFEMDTDITEDEDSFFDDLSGKGGHKRKPDEDESQKQGNLKSGDEQTSLKDFEPEDNKVTDDSVNKSQAALKAGSHLNSLHHKESKHLIPNGSSTHVILDFEDAPATLLISDMDQTGSVKPSQKEITDLVEREDVDSQQQFPPEDLTTDIRDDKEQKKETDFLDTLSDKLFNNFITDTMKQLTEIKMAKEQKIEAANQESGDLCGEHVEDEEWVSSVEQKDGLPFFLPPEKEELSSPELCNRPESPVFGASGQEELAKRLAELELSRELLDELGDDQDWFDEDFGLSSRREQQRLKQKQREEEQEARLGGGGGLGRSGPSAATTMGGLSSSPGGEQQAKTPPRPELPLPLPPKLPEQPAMVVPHSATEVEKMVHAATQEIWESCGLANEGTLPLTQLPTNPNPSQEYLGKEASGQDQEALAIRSYRKAVFDLTWEIIQEIFAEDPNADQPQWVKPQRVKSSFFHRVKTAGDLTKIQEFITAEVLKLYGLARDQSQKTDWQKMLKFGRKKRDRVDHILVQELHEEEAQWVNYDEDELFVKMQLADSIFDALLKDTANTLTLIYDKKARRDGLS